MIKRAYPIPHINQIISCLSGSFWFSSFDALKGYWQRSVAIEDRPKTAFVTIYGLYQWKRLPMGLHKAVAEWQSSMDRIFSEFLFKFMVMYIDDGLVYSNNFQQHVGHLRMILQKVQDVGLTLSKSKCTFGYQELSLLGYLVGVHGVRTKPSKVAPIVYWPIPDTSTALRGFIGILQYYRRFIPNCSELLAPLTKRLTKGESPFHWTVEANNNFIICKHLLVTAPILSLPDFTKPFILYTDASDVGIGAVLAQPLDEDFSNTVVIEYGNRMLESAETRYSAHDKEFLAVVYFTHYYRQYLIGKRFFLYTDHQALKYVLTIKDPPSRLFRWLVKLQDFDFDIIYRPGKANANADALSRLSYTSIEQEPHHYYLSTITTVSRLSTYTPGYGLSDKDYTEIYLYLSTLTLPQYLDDTQRKRIIKASRKYVTRDRVLLKKPCRKFLKIRAVPTLAQISTILKENHDHWMAGHQGVRLTFKRISTTYYWPNYFVTVEEYVRSCPNCQNFGPKLPLLLFAL